MNTKKEDIKQIGKVVALLKSNTVNKKNGIMYTKEAIEKGFNGAEYFGTNYQLACNYCGQVFYNNSSICNFCGEKRNENKKEN